MCTFKKKKRKDLFFYFYFWLTWVFTAASGPLVSVSEGGHSLAVVDGLLSVVASLVEHRP